MTTPVSNRRYDFITDLYKIGFALTASTPHRAPDARRTLAHLRRGLVGDRQQVATYELIFRHNPPEHEVETWVLIAGLFALHPMSMKISADTTLGAPMGALARIHAREASVTRRFTQLLGQNPGALPHYLRQCVQLLDQGRQPVDYRRLLDDVLVLTGPDHQGAQAKELRLRWVRDFHHNARTDNPKTPTAADDTGDSQETTA